MPNSIHISDIKNRNTFQKTVVAATTPSQNTIKQFKIQSSFNDNKSTNIAKDKIANLASKNAAESACSIKSYAHNIAVGATVGVGAGAIPCVVTTGAYLGCVALAGIGGAAGGAFQSAVECTMEKLN